MENPAQVKKIIKIPEKLLICSEDLCEKINKYYQTLDPDQKKTIYALYLILENSIEHHMSAEAIEPEKVRITDILYPPQAGGKLGLSRARACEYLKSFYNIDISETSLKRLLNEKLYTPYEDFIKAVLLNIKAKRVREVEKESEAYVIPTSEQEFMERPMIKTMITSMKTANLKERVISATIKEFYKYCVTNAPEYDITPMAPEQVLKLALSPNPIDRKKIYDRTDAYITYRIDEMKEKGYEGDVNSLIARLQTIQKWLGAQILTPGKTQKEYTGKYKTAEIPFQARNIIVSELLKMSRDEKDPFYLRMIQALILLYYTGSRRMVLVRSPTITRLRIDFTPIKASWEKVISVYGENEFYMIYTVEKRGIEFKKVIPKSWGDLLRKFALFTEDEIRRATKILGKIMRKPEILSLIDEVTAKYIGVYPEWVEVRKMEKIKDAEKYKAVKRSRVWHVWRHTANREALISFEWNYSVVAKLLGWLKESNLKIYGDYTIEEIFKLRPERVELKFCNDSLKREIERELKRAGLL